MPIRLSQIWQELKRRKIVYVITVYVGAAYVIIELINNISGPLRLPEWTLTLVIVLLAIGFPAVIIFSWMNVIHPEGGKVKAESADKVKALDFQKPSNRWKIASYISFVVIVGLIVMNVIPRTSRKEVLDKSIVVLPFNNLSSDQENKYFIDGVMESILDNLCRIKDLRVPGSTSVQQYEDNPKPIPVVAEEMDVAYVLEGSGQKIGNRLVLTIQLITGKDEHHIWSKQYDRVIEKVKDLIDIQKEVAVLVADEIEAIITPEENDLMGKMPTTDLKAYDLYERGMGEYYDYLIKYDEEPLIRAEGYFRKALGIDSTYSQAYVGQGTIYWEKQFLSGYFTGKYDDSVLILANIALSYDELSSEAYTLRGSYYRLIGNNDLALNDLQKAVRLNPNSGIAYFQTFALYIYSDCVKSLELLHKVISIDRGEELDSNFKLLGYEYFLAGFLDKSNHYFREALELSGDSASYYLSIARNAYYSGEYNIAIDYARKTMELDSTRGQEILGDALLRVGKHKEALEVYRNWLAHVQESRLFTSDWTHRIAYAYWINGLKKEAEYYFDKQIEYSLESINLNRLGARNYFSYYDLAGIYAFRGEKEKAYENLRIFNKRKEMPYAMVVTIKRDELFDNIRDEPEFQQIVRDIEAKYQATHERVRQWLEKNDML